MLEEVVCWASLQQGYRAHVFRLAHTSCAAELAGVWVCVIARCGGGRMFCATKSNSCLCGLQRPARSFHAPDRGEGGCVIYYRGQVGGRVRAVGAVRGCKGRLVVEVVRCCCTLSYLDGQTVGKLYL